MRLGAIGVAAAIVGAVATHAGAADIVTAPRSGFHLSKANAEAGVYDLIAPMAGLRAGPGERLEVEGLTLELLRGGQVIVSRRLDAARLVRDTAGLAELPVPALVNGRLLSDGGVDGAFAAPTRLSDDAILTEGEALLALRVVFATEEEPDALRIVARYTDSDGRPGTAVRETPVRVRSSPIAYQAPVRGDWFLNAAPSLSSHHRLFPPTEFAVDLFKVEDGRLSRGDPASPWSWFGYGAEVVAAADGVVVRAISDVPSDRAGRMKRRREDPEGEFAAYVDGLIADPLRAAFGNVVVLRHEVGGVVEYTTYGHLMAGSVAVREGQTVRRGQRLGRLGDTGEFIEPHLHFQVNGGPDPVTAESLPFRFEGVTPIGPEGDLGRLVHAR